MGKPLRASSTMVNAGHAKDQEVYSVSDSSINL